MNVEHYTVFRDPARYAGWPANYGMWGWGEELVLCFTLGFPDPNGGFHARDRNRPFTAMQARSLDGGASWNIVEAPLPGAIGLATFEHQEPVVADAIAAPSFIQLERMEFDHPEFAAMCGRTGLRTGAKSWFYTSDDRCQSWQGPFEIPMFSQLGIAARTDWLIDGPRSATLMLTATKPDGEEGRVFAARTADGGQSFDFISWVDEAPPGFQIMPSSLRLSSSTILTAVRSRGISRRANWIDIYRSDDNAESWVHVSRPVEDTGDGGNPAAMELLPDGRIVLVYGLRAAPYGIYAVVSESSGSKWSKQIEIRSGAGSHDIGYPKCIVKEDGSVVATYYYNDRPDGERYIAASIFRP